MDSTGVPGSARKENAAKVVQACIRCRQKKNKCDGRTPSCSACAARDEECVYRAYQRVRGPGKSKQHVRALEKRLADLEALAKQSGTLSGKESGAATAQGDGAGPTGPGHSPPTNEGIFPAEPVAAGLPSHTSTTLESDVHNLQIREEAARRFPLFKMVTDNMAGAYKSKATSRCLMSIPGDHVLVRESETWLVQNTIQTLCDEYPLFDVPALIQWVRDPATPKKRHKSSEWACMNALIAVGMHIKTINRSYKDVAPFAWAYLKNAYSSLPEVMIQENGINGAQAAIVMTMFMLRASGDTRTAAILLTLAVRMMQSNLRPADGPELETWKNAFWVSYALDVEMSLNCGMPPLHHVEDIDISLPRVNVFAGDDSGSHNAAVFPFLAQLAMIQSRVRRDLYAAKAFSLSDGNLIETVSDLGFDLEEWRSRVPFAIQPGRHGATSGTELETPVLMLHLVYYNALAMVHWAVERHTGWKPRAADNRVADSRVKAKTGAALTLHILPRIKAKPLTDIWRILPYIVASGLALLTFILREPGDVEAKLSRKSVGYMVEFVEGLVNDEGLPLQGILKGCTAIQEVITLAVGESPRPDVETGLPIYRHSQTQAVLSQLQQMTHPMYVAQALLGNTPNRDTPVARLLSEVLSMPWDAESSFSPWVPEALRPGGYGFKFDLTPRV